MDGKTSLPSRDSNNSSLALNKSTRMKALTAGDGDRREQAQEEEDRKLPPQEEDSKMPAKEKSTDEDIAQQQDESGRNHSQQQDGANDAEEDVGFSLSSFVESLPQEMRDFHREILLGMFLSLDSSELCRLEEETGCKLSNFAPGIGNNSVNFKQQHTDSFESPNFSWEKQKTQEGFYPTRPAPSFLLSLIPHSIKSIITNEVERNKSQSDIEKKSNQSTQTARGKEKEMNPPMTQQEINSTNRLTSPVEAAKYLRRKQHASMNLAELENHVARRFLLSDVGKKALAARNINYTAMIKGRVDASDLLEVSRSGGLRPDQAIGFKPLSLLYNECSMAAIAGWACDPKKKKSGSSDKISTSQTHCPMAATDFRLCQQCMKFGHYEIECPQLTGRMLFDLSDEIIRQKASLAGRPKQADPEDRNQASAEDDMNVCQVCRLSNNGANLLVCDGCDKLYHTTCLTPPLDSIPEGDWFCEECDGYNSDVSSVVDLEGLDDFVIEQRKRPNKMPTEKLASTTFGITCDKDENYNMFVGVADARTMADQFPEPLKEPVANDHSYVELQEGEMCWAKRLHAPKGKIGRDEWWPCQVINIINDPKSLRSFNIAVTPYLVRFLCAPHANRVRASHVLPFWENFERLGFEKVRRSRDKEKNNLLRAVLDALQLLGCKTFNQAFARVKEARENPRRRKAKRTAPAKRQRGPMWNSADSIEQDGFVIHAVKDPEGQNEMNRKLTADWPFSSGRSDAEKKFVLGSIVAWQSHHDGSTMVGTISSVRIDIGKALVRVMVDWESCLTPPKRRNTVNLASCRNGASLWISFDDLHLICYSPPKHVQDGFHRALLSREIEKAREQAAIIQHEGMSQHAEEGIADLRKCKRKRGQLKADNTSPVGVTVTERLSEQRKAKRQRGASKSDHNVQPLEKATRKKESMPSPTVNKADSPMQTKQSISKRSKNTSGSAARKAKGGSPRKKPRSSSLSRPTMDRKDSASADDDSDFVDSASGMGDKDDLIYESDDKLDDTISTTNTNTDQDEMLKTKNPRRKAKEIGLVKRVSMASSDISCEKDIDEMSDSELQARGLYTIEEILDERKGSAGDLTDTEFLIKWKGFPLQDATWEPASNILNQSYVLKYKCETLIKKLAPVVESGAKEDKQQGKGTPGGKVLSCLRNGLKEIDENFIEEKTTKATLNSTERLCPFCETKLEVGSAYKKHVECHRSGYENFDVICEAGAFARLQWYGGKAGKA